MKNKYMGIAIYIITFNIIWVLFDYVYVTFITKGTFSLSAMDMLTPLLLSIISALVVYGRKQ